jgi:hypothetical protein
VRRLLALAPIALLLAAAPAAAAPCEPTGVDVLAPASVVSPVVGAATDGERAFLVSRGLAPATVGVYDIDARRVVDNIELPTGDGGWGATVAGSDVYVGTYGSTADVHRVNPETRQVTQVARLEGDTFVWAWRPRPTGR